jgi:hypothetical protein
MECGKLITIKGFGLGEFAVEIYPPVAERIWFG